MPTMSDGEGAGKRQPRKRQAVTLTPQQRAALKRRLVAAKDPVRIFTPTRTQGEFRTSKAPFKALGGPNRSGKTMELVVELAMLLEGVHPVVKVKKGGKYLLAVPSRQQGAEVWGSYLLTDCRFTVPDGPRGLLDQDKYEVRWDRTVNPPTPRKITNRANGNSVLFVWSSGPKTQSMLEGTNFDGAILDESAGTQVLLDEIMLRILDAMADESRPGAGFVWWGFTETKVNEAAIQFLAKCEDPMLEDYKKFRIDPSENPAIDAATRKRLGEGLSEKARKIRIDGTGSAMGEVLIFPTLANNRERFILPKPYRPGPDDNIWIGFDPGVDHPCAIVFAHLGREHPRRLLFTHCVMRTGEGPKDAVEHIRRYLNGRKIAGFAYDPAGGRRREYGSGKSAIQQVADLMNEPDWWASGTHSFRMPNNRHFHGIMAIREMLDPPMQVSQTPLLGFDVPTPENGLGTLIQQMSQYRGREDLNFEGPQGLVKKNDDSVDAVRYLVMVRPVWVDYGRNLPFVNGSDALGSVLAKPREQWTEADMQEEAARERSKRIAERHRRHTRYGVGARRPRW